MQRALDDPKMAAHYTDMLIDASHLRIRSYAAAKGLSARRLAALAGMPYSTVREVLAGTGNPTSETLRQLESVIPKGWPDDKLG